VKRAAVLTAVLSLVACSLGGPAAPASKRTVPTRVALGDVRVGALFPTSGDKAAAGVDALHGAQLAAEVLDGVHPEVALPKLTVGSLVLDPADTGDGPQAASAAVDRLVGTDRVAAVTGALDSDATAAASQRAERLRVPMVSGSASAPGLTARGLRWFWRVGPSDRTDVETAFAWLHAASAERPKDRPIGRVVVIHSDDQAGRDGAALVEKLAPQDVGVTEDVQVPSDGSDLTPEVQRLAGYAPDALIAFTTTDDAVRLVQTMARVGYTPPALLGLGGGFADPRFASSLGALADSATAGAAWSPEIALERPVAAAVLAAYRREFGQDMTADSARDFEATLTIGMAIETADSTDPSRLRAALVGMHAGPGIMAWQGIRFDSSGENTLAGGVIEQLTGGQWHLVYPAAVATAPLVWPMPSLAARS
jgi:branched-chain amino acid transport system substrate-binding protein